MRKTFGGGLAILAAAVAAWAVIGCGEKDLRPETVATVNGEEIKVRELREFLGVRGGVASASGVPIEKKKEALDRLVAGRLLAGEARAKGLDNTDEFRSITRENERAVLLAALFRKEAASRGMVSRDEINVEKKKLKDADKNLTDENAGAQAGLLAAETKMRKLEEDLVAAARKDIPTAIKLDVIDRVAKGDAVPDNAVLATAGAEGVTLAEVRKAMRDMSGGAHGGEGLSVNPVAIRQILERDVTTRAIAAYARKQGIEGTEWMKSVRADMERGILIDLVAKKEVLGRVERATDKDLAEAYKKHADMLKKNGKVVPFAEVKDRLRGFLEREKMQKALEEYVADLKKKAKVNIVEALLPKV